MSTNNNDRNSYRSPLAGRYAGVKMKELFSDRRKFTTWRRLWLALAESQQKLGLDISDLQIQQMANHLEDIDYQAAASYEAELRHDVMAHIHAWGDIVPDARPVIHLGATSQFVNCNTDIILLREGLEIIRGLLVGVIDSLAKFAEKWKTQPCLGFTHFQPAQMTTVGKRAILWCSDFVRDLRDVEYRLDNLEFRGVKGTTGTQASYLALFDGDHARVCELDRLVAEKFNFERIAPVTGQTYTRKVDAAIVHTLAGVGISVHKFCNDIRLLAHRKELEEPFNSKQVGSSAMAYKRNPMRCERATGLARFLMDISASPMHTAAEQWLERTLDDSANRRLSIPEAFLSADACLRIVRNVSDGIVVYPKVIESHIAAELPFMATENILMAAVSSGGDRQELHEKIRTHSMAAAEQVKQYGEQNDLIERLKNDEAFAAVDFAAALDPGSFTGRASQQVDEYITTAVEPVRSKYGDQIDIADDLKV